MSDKNIVDVLRNAFCAPEVATELEVTKEDVCFYICEPVIHSLQDDRLSHVEEMKELKKQFAEEFPNCMIRGRVKSLSSIMGKIMQGRSIADVFGFKFVLDTNDTLACYSIYDRINKQFKIIDFDDRIKTPKANGYMDLKFVIVYNDIPIEFIIQTTEMYNNSRVVQRHQLAYPWKYTDAIKGLPLEIGQINIDDI